MTGWTRALALGAALLGAAPAAALEGLSDVQMLEAGADQGGAFCADFLLSKRAATQALAQSRRITQEHYLQRFDFLPCYVRGSARLDGAAVRWELRAGGNGSVTLADGAVVYLGCAVCAGSFGAR